MIAYKHNSKTGIFHVRSTVAVLLPTRQELEQYVTGFNDALSMSVGVTILHKKDNYNKAVGRERSVKNMTKLLTQLTNIQKTDGRNYFTLKTDTFQSGKDHVMAEIILSTFDGSDNVHLEGANVIYSEVPDWMNDSWDVNV